MIKQAQLLCITSALALISAPVIIIMGAFEPNTSLIGLTLTIIGGLGLFAGMRSLSRSKS